MTERCICGAVVKDLMADHVSSLPQEERTSLWVHVAGSDTRCTDVRRIDDVIPDRALTQAAAQQMADLGDRARRARGEVERFQSIIGELMEEVGFLRTELDQPGLIRRANLVAVWERLMSAGNLDGANTVRDMMQELKGTES